VSRPNSRTTRLRRWLAAWLEPMPDAGESWCLDCYLNDGKTKVLSADGTRAHAAEHAARPPDVGHPVKVIMKTRWRVI
jgi:hypothetical protein